MDPRLRAILLQLLQLAVEQESSLDQPNPEKENRTHGAFTRGWAANEMSPPDRHAYWPFGGGSSDQQFDFGGA